MRYDNIRDVTGYSILVGLATLILMLPACSPRLSTTSDLWDSVHILLIEDKNGTYPACTAFPIDQDKERTYFATANHCLRGDNFFLAGEFGTLDIIPAVIQAQNKKDDTAVLSVQRLIAPIALGHDPIPGDKINAAFFVKAVYRVLVGGTVASFPNPRTSFGTFAVHLAMPVSGSSGGPVFCEDQKAVCGIISGWQHDTPVLSMAVPVSNLRRLKWKEDTTGVGKEDTGSSKQKVLEP